MLYVVAALLVVIVAELWIVIRRLDALLDNGIMRLDQLAYSERPRVVRPSRG